MKYFITGGSGFIGTNFISLLLQNNQNKIINIDIKRPRNLNHEIFWKKINICEAEALKSVLNEFKPDYVIHLAARTDLDGTTLDNYETNIRGVENLVNSINELQDIKRVIFFSSMLVCRLGYIPLNDHDYCPTNFYGESKVVAEKIIRKNVFPRINWTILRPTSIWGPWFDVPYRNFFDAVLKGYMILPKNFSTKRSYGFVLNTVNQMLSILHSNKDNQINSKTLYLCDYKPLSLTDWAYKIQRASNAPRLKFFPIIILKLISKIGDFLKFFGFKNPPLTSSRLKNMLTNGIVVSKSLEDICGPIKYDIDSGIKITIDWLISLKKN